MLLWCAAGLAAPDASSSTETRGEAAPATSPGTSEDAETPVRTKPKRIGLRADVSLTHWFSDELASAPQGKSASFGLGWRPADWFIELYGRWEWTQLEVPDELPYRDLDGHHVDFTYLGVALIYPLRVKRQTMRLGTTALAVFPRLGGTMPSIGFSGGFVASLAFDLGKHLELGPFFDIRESTHRFRLPDGDLTRWQVDANVNVGVMVVL